MNARLSPPRSALLAVGAIFALTLISLGAVNVIAIYGRTTYTSVSDIAPTGQQVEVDAGVGDVQVRSSSDGRIRIETKITYGLRRPHIAQRETAHGIELEADCLWADSVCQVNYDISVPAGLAVLVSTGSGDIAASDLVSATRLTTGSGDISVVGLRGPLNLRTGSGDIRSRRTQSRSVAFRTGSGDINADFAIAPAGIEGRTGSGDITVAVPSESYRVDVDTGSGDEHVTVPISVDSERRIVLRAGSGDVRLRPTDG